MPELEDALAVTRQLQSVQLPSAFVEEYASLLEQHPDITWTCAKGIYGSAVAEHALAMLLALRRGLPTHALAQRWGPDVPSRPLVGSGDVVTLLGAGGSDGVASCRKRWSALTRS